MLYGLILVIHVFVSFVLIAVILLQAGRGGGLTDSVAGSAAQSMFGTRSTTYLTRATAVCAVLFMATSLSLAVISSHEGKSLTERLPRNKAVEAPKAAQPASPSQPAEPAAPSPSPETSTPAS